MAEKINKIVEKYNEEQSRSGEPYPRNAEIYYKECAKNASGEEKCDVIKIYHSDSLVSDLCIKIIDGYNKNCVALDPPTFNDHGFIKFKCDGTVIKVSDVTHEKIAEKMTKDYLGI